MSDTRVNTSGLKVLQVMDALKGHTLGGLSNGDLSKNLNMSAATVNRCLNTLIQAGMATQLDNGRYALSVRALQIAQAHANEMARASDRINELNQRVMAGGF
jgi:DNA-binding IclR family transcriptional regulator